MGEGDRAKRGGGGGGDAHMPLLHSCKKCLRDLPCSPRASAFWEHSIDLAERSAGSWRVAGRGPMLRVASVGGPPLIPLVASCASALGANTASAAMSVIAHAQTKLAIRIRSDIPVFNFGSSRRGAGYRSRGRNFKPSGSCSPQRRRWRFRPCHRRKSGLIAWSDTATAGSVSPRRFPLALGSN